MKKLVILAVALRLLVAAFIFHPDIKTIGFQTSFLKEGVFNIYSYLVDNKKSLPLKDNFVYFPLTYLTLGSYQTFISSILGSSFTDWLANADSNRVVIDQNIFKYLLALKLPYLIFDIAIAFLLLKYFDDPKLGKKAFTLWLFNPFTIFITYAFGNVDTFPVFFTVLSLMFMNKGKLKLSSLMLGIAAAFKIYPLLFVPFLVLAGKGAKEKITLGAIPFTFFGLMCLPFMSSAFLESTLISGLTTRIFNPGFNIGFGESIIMGLMLYAMLFFYAALFDKKPGMFGYWIIILLIIFSFSHFHIAWLLWVAPMAVILAVEKTKLSWVIFLLSIAAVTIPLLYEDRSMSVALYRVYSTWFDLLPTPFTAVQRFFDPYNLQSILHSLFAGGAAVVAYTFFRKEKAVKDTLN